MTSWGKFCLISLLILYTSVDVQGQNFLDSIRVEVAEIEGDTGRISYLLDVIWENRRRNHQLSLELLKDVEAIQENAEIAFGKDVSYYYYGIIYKDIGRYDASEEYLFKYYDLWADRDTFRLSRVSMGLANLYSDQGLWNKSMEMTMQSLRFSEHVNDTFGIINSTTKLGAVLQEMNQQKEALRYHRRALAVAITNRDSVQMPIANSNIGLCYEQLQVLDSALIYYREAFRLDSLMQDTWGLVYDHTQLGRILHLQGNTEEAIAHLRQAHKYAKQLQASSLIALSQLPLGSILIDAGNTDEGIRLLEEIIENNDYNNGMKDVRESHEALYKGYKKRGDLSNAIYHLEEYQGLADSMLNLDISNQISDLETKYETDKKEQEIALLNIQREADAFRIKNTRMQLMGVGLGFILMLGMAIWLYSLLKKIREQNQLISKSLEEKNFLLKEIHHRVKNNLQVVSSLLDLQSEHVHDHQAQSALLEGRNRVKSMALIHQNLYQEENLKGIDVKEYLEKLTSNLFSSYNIAPDKIHLTMDVDPIHLDVDTLVPLGLVINELISNALKHAFDGRDSGEVHVALKEEGETLKLVVSDNGVGMPTDQAEALSKSFGYRLIDAFSTQLDADLSIDGGQGTSVTMMIRDFQKAA